MPVRDECALTRGYGVPSQRGTALVVQRSLVARNRAATGGAFFASQHATITVNASRVTANQAASCGALQLQVRGSGLHSALSLTSADLYHAC